ncbi:hypothetical protein ACFSTH_14715 [Paenibacillus yanchengensis]|uniref:DUF4083 domain-containing protein n=1 Tax=Paenibacillus yanchengensis TaxID=2035833 RepID=A0ABW4YFI9_9BACL
MPTSVVSIYSILYLLIVTSVITLLIVSIVRTANNTAKLNRTLETELQLIRNDMARLVRLLEEKK